MTREEFILCLNCIEQGNGAEELSCTVSEEDYKIIEEVYTWHPAISASKGKMQIAALYYAAGMGFILNMVSEARGAKEATLHIQQLKNELKEEEKRISSIKEKYGAFRVIGDKNDI